VGKNRKIGLAPNERGAEKQCKKSPRLLKTVNTWKGTLSDTGKKKETLRETKREVVERKGGGEEATSKQKRGEYSSEIDPKQTYSANGEKRHSFNGR